MRGTYFLRRSENALLRLGIKPRVPRPNWARISFRGTLPRAFRFSPRRLIVNGGDRFIHSLGIRTKLKTRAIGLQRFLRALAQYQTPSAQMFVFHDASLKIVEIEVFEVLKLFLFFF
jgi:hypothetical protein